MAAKKQQPKKRTKQKTAGIRGGSQAVLLWKKEIARLTINNQILMNQIAKMRTDSERIVADRTETDLTGEINIGQKYPAATIRAAILGQYMKSMTKGPEAQDAAWRKLVSAVLGYEFHTMPCSFTELLAVVHASAKVNGAAVAATLGVTMADMEELFEWAEVATKDVIAADTAEVTGKSKPV